MLKILTIVLAVLSLLASAAIVIPAPNIALLLLTVPAVELAPWLIILNIVGMVVAQRALRPPLAVFIVGLLASTWPIANIAGVQREAERQFSKQGFAMQPGMTQDSKILVFDSLRGVSVPKIAAEVLPLNIFYYQPSGIKHSGRLPPVVVDIYGGGWQRGSPSDSESFHRYLAGKGYAVFAIDYRHAPAAMFPAQIDDVRAALKFISQNAARYGVDASRLVLCGRSAGGQLALLAAYTSTDVPVKGVISFYGPSDLTLGYSDLPSPDPLGDRAVLETYLGGTPSQIAERYREASPVTYADRPQPPTLLLQGRRDHIVKAEFAHELQQKLMASDNRALLVELPWSEHAFDVVFSGLGDVVVLPYVEQFLADTLK